MLGFKITVETRTRWLLTIHDHLVIFAAVGCKKTKILSYLGLLGLKMTIGTRAYGRKNCFLEACWYSIVSTGHNGNFETKHAKITQFFTCQIILFPLFQIKNGKFHHSWRIFWVHICKVPPKICQKSILWYQYCNFIRKHMQKIKPYCLFQTQCNRLLKNTHFLTKLAL